ncbi:MULTISPECIES: cobalamin biosynthesis protein [unclassified Pseudomonas]|nr:MULTISPECIES: cobalamin biosynthesis protein [unclassified Pseudomonas]
MAAFKREAWMIVIGIGCRRHCVVGALRELLALALVQCPGQVPRGLASHRLKANEPALLALADELRLPLFTYDSPALAHLHPRLTHHSAITLERTGCAGVAESAALAHCEYLTGQPALLRVARIANGQATLAIAQGTP